MNSDPGMIPHLPCFAGGGDETIDSPSYDFSHADRGMAIVINNIKFEARTMQKSREGAQYDTDNVRATLDLLGFNVLCYENLTTTEMVKVLRTGQFAGECLNTNLIYLVFQET